MKNIFTIAVLTLILSACSWVNLTSQGEKVRILSMEEVKHCKRLGKTTVSLKSKIAGIERNREKVQKELNILARNGAVDLNGDAVVALDQPVDGKQTFAVYRCINP